MCSTLFLSPSWAVMATYTCLRLRAQRRRSRNGTALSAEWDVLLATRSRAPRGYVERDPSAPGPGRTPGPPAPMARRRLSTTTLVSRAAQAGPRPVRRRSRRHRPRRSRTRSLSAFRQRSLPGVFSTNRSATGVASVRLEDGCRSLPRTRYRTSCLVGVPIAAKRNTPPFVDCFDEWSTCCHSRPASVRGTPDD